MKQDLKDKVVLVTGASSGIGLATGRALAEQGAHVIFRRSAQAPLDEIAAEMRGQGKSALALALDVTSDESVNECTALALAAWGRIDVAIAAAGAESWPAGTSDCSGSTVYRQRSQPTSFTGSAFARWRSCSPPCSL